MERFKSFSNSLLNRSTKLSDLANDLERELELSEKGPDSAEGKRVQKFLPKLPSSVFALHATPRLQVPQPRSLLRLVEKLEASIDVLETQHKQCESVRAQVGRKLSSVKGTPPSELLPFRLDGVIFCLTTKLLQVIINSYSNKGKPSHCQPPFRMLFTG